MRDVAAEHDPAVIVICAELDEPRRAAIGEIEQLAGRFEVALAGRGATAEQARRTGARLLQDAPVTATARMAEGR